MINHGAAVRQRHAPTPIINAHISARGHNAAVGPQRKLHPAGDRRTLDRSDDRLAKREPRRTHRAARHWAAVGGKFQGSVGLGIVAGGNAADGKAFQVRSGAERAALTPEDGNVRRLVAVESDKRFIQRLRMFGIDGVARLGA